MKSVDQLKREWSKSDEAEIDAAIRALLDHRHGRRLLWWLLQIGRVGTQPFTRNALDTAFGCGELNIGNQVLERIVTCSPESYIVMMKENADEHRTRESQLTGARDAGKPGGRYTEPDPFDGADSGAEERS